MVRPYHALASDPALPERARRALLAGGLRGAAREIGLPLTTLHRWLRPGGCLEALGSLVRRRPNPAPRRRAKETEPAAAWRTVDRDAALLLEAQITPEVLAGLAASGSAPARLALAEIARRDATDPVRAQERIAAQAWIDRLGPAKPVET